jgi:hypothetical protein
MLPSEPRQPLDRLVFWIIFAVVAVALTILALTSTQNSDLLQW